MTESPPTPSSMSFMATATGHMAWALCMASSVSVSSATVVWRTGCCHWSLAAVTGVSRA